MFTIDASVWVNSFDQREVGNEVSRQLLDFIRAQAIPVTVPNLALIEVAASISRTRNNPVQAHSFTTSMNNLPNVRVLPIDEALAHRALLLAAEQSLRGADAIYAAVAIQEGCTLVSLDNEHLTRLVGVVETRTPTGLLDELTARQEDEG
jgi:predicted nucleic acid-binding protein